MNHLKKIIILILPLLVSSTVSAREVQFIYFNQPNDTPKVVRMYTAVNTKIVEVNFPKYNFSPAHKIPKGAQTLRFLPVNYIIGDEFPLDAPSVKIPKTWSHAIILVFKDSENSLLPLRFKALNANPDTFGNGNSMFINFSPKVIYGKLGETKLVVAPKKILVVKNPGKQGVDYFANLRQANPDKSEDYRFLTKMWRYHPNKRQVIFIYVPPGRKNITYHVTTIREKTKVVK